MSPAYYGPLHAWTCRRCKRVWHMRPGITPPPTGCGNSFAGCAGREDVTERAAAHDLPEIPIDDRPRLADVLQVWWR